MVDTGMCRVSRTSQEVVTPLVTAHIYCPSLLSMKFRVTSSDAPFSTLLRAWTFRPAERVPSTSVLSGGTVTLQWPRSVQGSLSATTAAAVLFRHSFRVVSRCVLRLLFPGGPILRVPAVASSIRWFLLQMLLVCLGLSQRLTSRIRVSYSMLQYESST